MAKVTIKEGFINEINTRLSVLSEENDQLVKKHQECSAIMGAIVKRCDQIKGAVDTLNDLKSTIALPGDAQEAIDGGFGVHSYTPSGVEVHTGSKGES